jgi:uncharacterized protein YndB with AHSA1/START domain
LNLDLKFEVYAKIKKPIEEVFDAVYNPNKLKEYFATGSASGALDEGKEVTWDFHDFPGAFPVHVKQTIKNEKIVLEWANSEGNNNQVEMTFEALDGHSTLVKIKESGWKNQIQKSLDESYSHCEGWMQMLCCLKVYVEFGKNLREFFF